MSALVERVQTWNPAREPEREFDYIDLSAVDNSSKAITGATRVSGVEAPSRARQLVLAGDVLVSTVRPNLNAVAVVPPTLSGATASTGFTVLRPSPRIDARYLFHWVRSPQFVSDMVRKSTGASYPAVSDRIVKDSLIPTPDLSKQRRIAAILDLADAIRTKWLQALAHLESLELSLFRDTFGPPHHWTSAPVGDLGQVTTGRTPPTGADGMFDGPIPFVTPGDLSSGVPVVRTVTQQGAAASRLVRSGSTLVCCIGATIGKVGVTTEPSAFNQQINAVEWGDSIDDAYGLAAMRNLKPVIVARGASTTLPLLPKRQFVKLQIPVPPLAVQKSFASRIAQTHIQRAAVTRALAVADELFASLQTRAFRGEL